MASFAFQGYQQQQQQQQQTAMPVTSANDFTLFPAYDWQQEQPFLPTTTSYQEQAYLQATTYDSAFSHPAYSNPQLEQMQYNGIPQYQQKQAAKPALSPKQSPAHSATHSFENSQTFLSSVSDSGASAHSTISSAMASPSVMPQNGGEWAQQRGINFYPGIVQHDETFTTTGLEFETIPVLDTKGCVDPSLIQPFSQQYADVHSIQSPHQTVYQPIPSPAPSVRSIKSPHQSVRHWQPYPQHAGSRRQSISSVHSRQSVEGSVASDDSNKGLCATCGRHFKDLKAHQLTHQETRPEKCPIPTCEYSTKGFARKYDKNRHTLTHYKGTMVCGFCPGSGSAAEKSFNRADVFKRHLTSVHNVEQTAPNARRKTPPSNTKRNAPSMRDTSGMCSTCNNVFANPQDFYEHLDDCVLRVVRQADPAEAINQRLLSSVADDANVQETMDRHMLPNNLDFTGPTTFDEPEDDDDDEDDVDRMKKGSRGRKGGNPS